MNAERKRAWERMEALQEEIRKPLMDWEERDKRRLEAHEAALALVVAARNDPFAGTDSALIKERMDNLPGLMNREWEEFSMKAIQEADASRLHLETMYHLSLKMEKDAADLARLRAEEEERTRKFHALYQEAHDENVAFTAAYNARRAAEEKAAKAAEAERQRVEREAQAERERVQREKEEAAAAAETERQRIEQQRLDAEERTRKAQEKAAADKATMDKVLADALQAAEDAKAEALRKADAEKAAAIEKERQSVADEKAREEKATAERERNRAHKKKINNEVLEAIQKAAIAAECSGSSASGIQEDGMNQYAQSPWHWDNYDLRDKENHAFARIVFYDDNEPHNAARIVNAVNNHDVLVKTLENAHRIIELIPLGAISGAYESYEEISKILAAAKGDE